MRDRILEYLNGAGHPVSAGKILLDVLRIHSPSDKAAARILGGILADDSRFILANGLWTAREEDKEEAGRAWEAEAVFLFMESVEHKKYLRGAIRFPDGKLSSFDTSIDTPEHCREVASGALPRLTGRPLVGWQAKDLRLWELLLGSTAISGLQGKFLSLRSMAERVLAKAGRISPGAVASALHATAPGECPPEAMVRFLAGCFPLLFVLVPDGDRRDVRSLQSWISAGSKKVNFSRFDFGPEFLKEIPESAGVYVMKDRRGRVIYVGKSGNLRRRIGSYFTSRSLESPKIARIHNELHSVDVLPAANEVEALLLEMRLIRRFRPDINLQTEIHARPARRNRKNLLLLVGAGAGKPARVYFLREGRFTARRSAPLHRPPSAQIREKIRSVYYSKRRSKSSRIDWEVEIVASWVSGNRGRLNWIDVDEAGNYRDVIRRLTDYLNDPGELSRKVYYR